MVGIKKCKQCGKDVILKIKRDLIRKNFCCRSCRSTYYYYELRALPLKPPLSAHSKESRKKAGLKMRGENHWKWIVDRTQLKLSRFNNSERKGQIFSWRKDVFERDKYTCQICKQRGAKLVAHHLKSWAEYPLLRFNLNNGMTLCENCHKSIHYPLKYAFST